MRLIDADGAKRIICEHENRMRVQHRMIYAIETLPTIEAKPVVHGRWIPIPEYENKRCSVCRTVFSDFTLGYYCPRCGARMDEDGGRYRDE